MITKTMNQSIQILRKAYAIKGRVPRYVNLWSFRKIVPQLQKGGVPQEKIDILFDIYRTIRFGS